MNKYFKKSIGIILTIGVILGQSSSVYAIENGVYKLPIKIMKKYDEEISMGNAGIEQYGLFKVDGENKLMKIRFKPLSMFGFFGYLSEFDIRGEAAKVLTVYDVIDNYNDPIKSKDEKVKGKKYPKDMEFSINEGENDVPIHVYVPVMGELSSGDQDARFRVDWPSDFNLTKVNSYDFDSDNKIEEKVEKEEVEEVVVEEEPIQTGANKDGRVLPVLEKGEALKLEDGVYSIKASLYHEREDKPSMGNAAMVQNAEIFVKDNKASFLLGSDKMKLMNIVASLVSFQVRDDNEYYHFATPHAFDLVLPDEKEKRPEVFSFDINRKDPFIYVKVNPKVKPMGEKPIGARLKIDWNSLNKIDEKNSVLYYKMKNGSSKTEFDPNQTIIKKSDNIELVAGPGAFDEDIVFKQTLITGGQEYIDFTRNLGRSTPVKIYDFIIENEYGSPLEPKKNIKINIPIKNAKDINKVVKLNDGSRVDFNINGDSIELSLDTLGKVGIVFKEKKPKKTYSVKASTKPKKIKKEVKKKEEPKKIEKKKEQPKKEESKKETKKEVQVLKNEKEDFNEPEKMQLESNIEGNEVQEDNSAKENPKVIFFCVLFLLSIISLASYVYIKIGEKLIYEIKFSKTLKEKIEKTGGKDA